MSDISPTRSAVLEMRDERRAMHEGHVFLDEKCLLLAGEILRELARQRDLRRRCDALDAAARRALQAAVARLGLQGLQVHPAADLAPARLRLARRALMGVPLQQTDYDAAATAPAAAVEPNAEAEACRAAYAELLRAAVPLAAVEGNLERLADEYRRTVRRARALQDVMLPELDATISEVEGRLEELEQEEAIGMRRGLRV
ncbi:MAG: V-type ATP synthase subunit D [Burkholderiales bacterium]|nr:V-type ATP synthase subunit D [Burkholderiales bacterium]